MSTDCPSGSDPRLTPGPSDSTVRFIRDNLVHNLKAVRSVLPADTLVCASVKANAYGHGMEETALTLQDEGVGFFGVATINEGLRLRSCGVDRRIVLYGAHSPDQLRRCIAPELEPMVADEAQVEALADEARRSAGPPVRVHLKVDTGMGRVGCRPEEAMDMAGLIHRAGGLELAGLATHFAVSDSGNPEDRDYTRAQFGRLREIAGKLEAEGLDPGIIHAANSGAIALHGGFGAESTMVRPGIVLYGYGPALPVAEPQRPVMEWSTRVAAVKWIPEGSSVSYGRTWNAPGDTHIAVLPIGYADGYSRLLSNKAEVLIGNRRYPIVGTVCMDQCMVNLGPRTDVKVDDRVVLFGPDPAGPDAEELASLIGTISYEITCGVGTRTGR